MYQDLLFFKHAKPTFLSKSLCLKCALKCASTSFKCVLNLSTFSMRPTQIITLFKIATCSSSSDALKPSYSIFLFISVYTMHFLSPLLQCKFHEGIDLCLYCSLIFPSSQNEFWSLLNICLMNSLWIGDKKNTLKTIKVFNGSIFLIYNKLYNSRAVISLNVNK